MKNKIRFLLFGLIGTACLMAGCKAQDTAPSSTTSVTLSDPDSQFSSALNSENSSKKPAKSSSFANTSSSVATSKDEKILTCNHDDMATINTPATCVNKGYVTYVCNVCGQNTKIENVDKLEHRYDYEIALVSYESSMFGPSRKTYKTMSVCLGCGATKSSTSFTKANYKVAIDTVDNIDSSNACGYVISESGSLKAVPCLGYSFDKWSSGETKNSISTYSDSTIAIFKQLNRELPIISVKLSNNKTLADVDRSEALDASYEIKNSNSDFSVNGTFKGRGNGSWEKDTGKSGYSIKFESKKKLLNMNTKSKKWIIVPCSNDASLHVNYTAYNIGKTALPGIEWQPDDRFAEVYINNEYRGVYLVSEKIGEETGRLEIKTEDSTGEYDLNHANPGFLIEYDRYATREGQSQSNYYLEHEPTENYTYFKVNNLYRQFSVKYPDPDDLSMFGGVLDDSGFNKVVLKIKDIMNNFSAVLDSGKYEELEKVVEIDSLLDVYLVHELFKNSDVGWSSFYLYKKPNENKLRFGPVWDFDLSAIYSRTNSIDGKHISTKTLSGQVTNNVTSSYNDMLVKATKLIDEKGNKKFADLLNERFKTYYKNILSVVASCVGGNDNSYVAFAQNSVRWGKADYAKNLSSLLNWLVKRGEWMINNNFVY